MPKPSSPPARTGRILGILTAASAIALAACSSAPTEGGYAGRGGSGKQAYRTKLDGWGPQTPPAGFPKFIDHSVGQEEISMQAMGLVGVPYRWGGNTPAAGFDCSGLVRYVVDRAARVDLPRTTADMSREGTSISPSEVAPGDLIFFNTSGRAHSHVGIYVGDYRFVNAPSTGGTVRIDYVTNPYWAKRFDGIRRIAGRNETAPILDTPVMPPSPQRTDYASTARPEQTATVSPYSAEAQTRAPALATAPAPVTATAPMPSPAPALAARTLQAADPIAAIARADRSVSASSPSTSGSISASRTGQNAGNGIGEVRTAQAVAVTPNQDDPIARMISRGGY